MTAYNDCIDEAQCEGLVSDERADPRGTSIGRFVVLDVLGRSVTRTTYKAYDPVLRREVALEVWQLQSLSREHAARFERDAQTLAQLSHPNIVGIYDLVLDEQSVVLAMEHVAGQTLETWLASPRSWQAIADAFRQAGQGLAAAHRFGLVHGCFAPRHVLVSDEGRVLLTGFASRSSGAEFGREIEALDAAADHFAFCVALWEALGGQPFRRNEDDVPPMWPADRQVPRRIIDAVRQGLQREPAERGSTLKDLLDVLAYDPPRRTQKLVIASAVATVVAGSGTAAAAWHEQRALRCSGAAEQLEGVWDADIAAAAHARFAGGFAYAQTTWNRVEQTLDDYSRQWVVVHTNACEATVVRREQSEQDLDRQMSCLWRARVELQATTQQLAQADAAVVERADALLSGLPALARCSDVEALAREVQPPVTDEDAKRVEALREQLAQAHVRVRVGKYEEAHALVAQLGSAAEGLDYAPLQTELALLHGLSSYALGQHAEAEAALEDAARSGMRLGQWREALEATHWLSYVVGFHLGRHDEGLRVANMAQALVGQPEFGVPERASIHDTVGVILSVQGRYAEAEAEARASLENLADAPAAMDTFVVSAHNNLGSALMHQGKFAEAEASYRAALATLERALGPEHPRAGGTRSNLATALMRQGRYDDAEAMIRSAIAVWEKSLPPGHADFSTARGNLASVLFLLGKLEEAEALYRGELNAWKGGEGHPAQARLRHNLGLTLHARGRYAEAEVELRKALADRAAAFGPDHPALGSSHNELGHALREQGKLDEAETEYRRALAIRRKSLGPQHPDVAGTLHGLASTFLHRGAKREAREHLEAAWQIRSATAVAPELRGQTAFELARLTWALHDRERALELADAAVAAYAEGDAAFDEQRHEVERWLLDKRSTSASRG